MPAANVSALATRLVVQHARAAGQLSRRRKLPRQLPPTAIELAYVRAVKALVIGAAREAYAPLLRELPALVAGAARRRGDSLHLDDKTEEERARELVRQGRDRMAAALDERAITGAARKVAADTDRHVAGQLGRQIKAGLGIDLVNPDDRRLKAIVDGFIHENVALIQDLTPGLASRIESTVLKALTTGTLHEDLAKQLQDNAFGYAENRAELIAIDQVGKLTGQLNRQRQLDLGVTQFVWKTVGDERVRGKQGGKYPKAKPSHDARDGKTYSWADGVAGRNGEREFPGTPIRCRCHAEPVLDKLLEDLPDPGADVDLSAVEGKPPVPALSLVPPAPARPIASPEQIAARAAREAQIAAERQAWEAHRQTVLAAQQQAIAGAAGAPPPPPPAPPAPPGGGAPIPPAPPPGGGGAGGPPPSAPASGGAPRRPGQGDVDTHDADPVVRHLETGNVLGDPKAKPMPGGHVNEAYEVTLLAPDGSTMRAVWKPTPTHSERSNIAPSEIPTRERAASVVADQLGVRDMLPATTTRTIGGEHGSLQALAERADEPEPRKLDHETLARMRVFDFIIGNSDRHGGNVLWRNGQPVLIDHGYSFPSGPPDYFMQPTNPPSRRLTKALVDAIAAIDETRLAGALHVAGLDVEAVRHTLYRVRALKADPQVLRATAAPTEDRMRWEGAARRPRRTLSHE